MKNTRPIFIIFIILTTYNLAEAGKAHYVDCGKSTNGSGSFTSPFNSIEAIRDHNFNTGDDLYFKVGEMCKATKRLSINWSGTQTDRVIIGAYYGENKFGLSGHQRPIIDGDLDNNLTQDVPSDGGLIQSHGEYQYITIKDLRIQYSGSYGVLIKQPDYVNVENCHIFRSAAGGIVYASQYKKYGLSDGVEYGRIYNNIIEEARWPKFPYIGACIEITSLGVEPWPDGRGRTHHIIVSHNKIFNGSNEGIGIYQRATDCIVEYNVVRDVRSYMIYIDQSERNIIRYNLVYESSEVIHPNLDKINYIAIAVDNESSNTSPGACVRQNTKIYGNLIAGVKNGIRLENTVQNEFPDCVGFGDTKIFNNTIINCLENQIFIDQKRLRDGDNILIKNNLSYTANTTAKHMVPSSSEYITWSNNFWDDSVSGDASNSQSSGYPKLMKANGWDSLRPDELTGIEFMPLDGSPVTINGQTIDGYENMIFSSNFREYPIKVEIQKMNSPHIGAYISNPTLITSSSMTQDTSTNLNSIPEGDTHLPLSIPPPPSIELKN